MKNEQALADIASAFNSVDNAYVALANREYELALASANEAAESLVLALPGNSDYAMFRNAVAGSTSLEPADVRSVVADVGVMVKAAKNIIDGGGN